MGLAPEARNPPHRQESLDPFTLRTSAYLCARLSRSRDGALARRFFWVSRKGTDLKIVGYPTDSIFQVFFAKINQEAEAKVL